MIALCLHIETSLLLKQKDNIDPCEICGPEFVVSRKGDTTIRCHAKGHAPDSDLEYVVFRDILLSYCKSCKMDIIHFTRLTITPSKVSTALGDN